MARPVIVYVAFATLTLLDLEERLLFGLFGTQAGLASWILLLAVPFVAAWSFRLTFAKNVENVVVFGMTLICFAVGAISVMLLGDAYAQTGSIYPLPGRLLDAPWQRRIFELCGGIVLQGSGTALLGAIVFLGQIAGIVPRPRENSTT